jgi:hypothetical protein
LPPVCFFLFAAGGVDGGGGVFGIEGGVIGLLEGGCGGGGGCEAGEFSGEGMGSGGVSSL